MLFTADMKKKFQLGTLGLLFVCFSFTTQSKDFNKMAKIAIREIGNQLLLINKDSTSIVKPIELIEDSKYSLSFQNNLKIYPDSLVAVIAENFKVLESASDYLVEVLQCRDGQVAYSYQIVAEKDKTIVPCSGRPLPLECYTIEVEFLNQSNPLADKSALIFVFGAITIGFVLFGALKKKKFSVAEGNKNYTQIGNYQFYKHQNKLIREAEEISLSRKECELLDILASNLNDVVTRDELTKRVWEDNGVIVGRSLDTFISKLRKKLKNDTSIKLTNVHGVGYKLELT